LHRRRKQFRKSRIEGQVVVTFCAQRGPESEVGGTAVGGIDRFQGSVGIEEVADADPCARGPH
jgi:hypothetical protein